MMKMEDVIGMVLRAGVFLSTACLVLGLGAAIAFGGGTAAHVLLHAGIIILLATPVSRVVVSIVEYSIARDWTFAALTTIVFLELTASAIAALVFKRRL
jgi:uncharacterized membrane protein